jgi:hypothetical protein
MQIKALIAEEKRKVVKRKQEVHELDIRQREAQMAGATSARPTVTSDPVTRGMTSVSASFHLPSVSKFSPSLQSRKTRHCDRARNTFDPGNLPYLENLVVDDVTSDATISFEDGKVKQSKNVGKASAIKTPAIWSKNFIIYLGVISIFHGVQHPKILDKLLEFHNIIIELS